MFRIAFASVMVVVSAAGTASAGLFNYQYPSSHVGMSSEYVAACNQAGGCDMGPACGRGSYSSGGDCCSSLWDNYCADRHQRSCRTKLHTRYHWFARPTCGCETAPACGCDRPQKTIGCGNDCTGCLGHHKRGFWSRCRGVYQHDCSCGQPGCETCGGATDIIRLEDEMPMHGYEMQAPVAPTPATQDNAAPMIQPADEEADAEKPEAMEARLLPSLRALLPRN